MPEPARDRIVRVLKEFRWHNYGLEEVALGLADYPEEQQWVPNLAGDILAALDDTPFHVAQFHPGGSWTIKHLLDCRPELLSCPFTHARPDRTPPAGEYHVELNPADFDEMVIIDG